MQRTASKVGFSVNCFPMPGKAGKLPEIPFCKHDGPEVEIAAAGNVWLADLPLRLNESADFCA
jgi:hypothetical protein